MDKPRITLYPGHTYVGRGNRVIQPAQCSNQNVWAGTLQAILYQLKNLYLIEKDETGNYYKNRDLLKPTFDDDGKRKKRS